jgi:hypothetical protein
MTWIVNMVKSDLGWQGSYVKHHSYMVAQQHAQGRIEDSEIQVSAREGKYSLENRRARVRSTDISRRNTETW